jgi:hypothetical protein
MCVLRFPPTGGGEEHGLNDPGIETFEGNMGGHTARECTQNVGDAAAVVDGVVRLTFDVLNVPLEQIPCAKQLERVFLSCKEFWSDNPKTVAFFSEALQQIRANSIRVLRISDFGTTGLTGGDAERDGKWYCLVRSGGVSNKTGGTGGSYGIGKFAPFAASAIRTVLYSTLTQDGQVAFQGVSRLVSHIDESGETTQGTGYIGQWNAKPGQFAAIRIADAIPEQFRRNEAGTDIYVLGFRDGEGWERHLTRAILQDFWPAIVRRKVDFRIGRIVINHETLEELMKQFSSEPEFEAHLYLRAHMAPDRREFSTVIEGLGRVELYLVAGSDEYPKRVALTRKTGMVITTKRFNSRKPFIGYFVCENNEGNELLRSLEPPRHDTWEDPDRGTAISRRALRDVFVWIRQCIRDLNPASNGETLDVPDLARYLPDDAPDGQEDAFVRNSLKEGETSLTPLVPPRQMPVHVDNIIPPQTAEWKPTSGDEMGGGKDGGIGQGGGGNGSSVGGDESGPGGKGPRRRKKPGMGPVLSLRSMVTDSGYRLIIRSDRDFEGELCLNAVGDDGLDEPVEIEHVKRIPSGEKLASQRGVISGLKLKAGTAESLDVRLVDRGPLALSLRSK